MGSSIAIIGFTIWPDLTGMQSLNYAIKTRPMVTAYYPVYLANFIYIQTHLYTQKSTYMHVWHNLLALIPQ